MSLSYDEAALEELGNLPKKQRQNVVNKIDRLCLPEYRHSMLKEKTTIDGERLYRARIGIYRILYTRPQGQDVVIYSIKNRNKVYR